MPRVDATVPPDAIRIEDEVWQEAFARREPGQSRSRRRLQAVDGNRTSSTLEPHATAADQTAEPAAVPDWLGPATIDSGPTSGADSLGAPRARASARADSLRPRRAGSAPADSPFVRATRPVASPTSPATRRTVVIRGRGAEGHLPWPDASPRRRAYERAGFRPDRLAMWAVLLGLLLVLVAILSAH